MFKGDDGFPQDVLSSLTLVASNLNLEDTWMMYTQKVCGGTGQGVSTEQGFE